MKKRRNFADEKRQQNEKDSGKVTFVVSFIFSKPVVDRTVKSEKEIHRGELRNDTIE